MSKPTRSSTPQALSVASITAPGDVALTLDRILEFDDARISFTHATTWAAMPAARRGVIKASSSALVYPGTHPRVEACIQALCELGERQPVETKRFADFPQAGLTINRVVEWGPGVSISVKAVCWHIVNGVPVLPLLQPRKLSLADEATVLYATLGKQAYGKGDWTSAETEIVDLSGEDDVYANVISHRDLKALPDARVRQYVDTYMEAKKAADAIRATRPKSPPKSKGDDLFDRL